MRLVAIITLVFTPTFMVGWLVMTDFVFPTDACRFVQGDSGLIKTRINGTCNPNWDYLTVMFFGNLVMYFILFLCLLEFGRLLARGIKKSASKLS